MDFLYIIITLILLFLLFLYIIYLKTFYNSPSRNKKSKFRYKGQAREYSEKIKAVYRNLADRECERVFIKNRSKIRLAARYYHKEETAPLAILFHGYRSKALFDSGGGYEILSSKGFNILIPDQRAHGDSEGHSISFGINERYDCLDWVEYAKERFGENVKIILVGVSMGAATVLMAAELELPSNVRCIIADCPYSSPEGIIRKVITDLRLPGWLYPFVRLSGMLYGGFDIEKSSPLKATEKLKVPAMLIHGDKDGFVPCDMSRQLHKCGKTRLLEISGADHGLSYIVDTELYTVSVNEFLDGVI